MFYDFKSNIIVLYPEIKCIIFDWIKKRRTSEAKDKDSQTNESSFLLLAQTRKTPVQWRSKLYSSKQADECNLAGGVGVGDKKTQTLHFKKK